MAAPMRICFVLSLIAVLIAGIIDVLRNFEDNKCEMTWMFQQPEYMQINLNNKIRNNFPRYGLYFYGEGSYAKDMRKKKFNMLGVPVLFVPGNAGSYKQVRSLGSVAMRKAEHFNNYFHFNYFAVDLNEEFSALNGGILRDQVKFVHKCVIKILSMYKSSSNPPSSVIVIGHSMGGMIARALFTLPGFDPTMVRTIITQATPHQSLSLTVDPDLTQFYKKVNSFWVSHQDDILSNVVVVSTGGGFRDVQVRQDLTSLSGIVSPNMSISTSTMSVPKAWVSTDHLCAVWCRQMVLATQRALFDLVDRNTKQETEDINNKLTIFRHHFLRNQGSKQFLRMWEEMIELEKMAHWDIITDKSWSISKLVRAKFVYLAVPIGGEHSKSFVATSNAKIDNWILVCKFERGEKSCKTAVNLAERGEIIPPLYSNKKMIQVDLNEFKEFTHLVLVMPRGDDKVTVMGEMLSHMERDLKYQLPSILDILSTYPQSILSNRTVLVTKGGNSIFRNVTLKGLNSVFKSYTAHLEYLNCEISQDEYDGTVARLHFPYSHQDVHNFFKQGISGDFPLKLFNNPLEGYDDRVQLHLYLQHGCDYRLSVRLAILDTGGQFARFYCLFLPAFIVANILMAYVGQLRALSREGNCPSFLDALASTSKPYFVIPVTELIRFLMNWEVVTNFIHPMKFPEDDSVYVKNMGLWFRAFPLVMYFASLSIVTVHAFLVHSVLNILAYCLKFVGKICCNSRFCIKLSQFFHYLLILASITLAATTCGSLGILICYVTQLLKVLRLFYLCKVDSADTASTCKRNFHFTLLLLMMWLQVMNIAPLLIWGKSLQFDIRLDSDPSRLTAIAACIGYLILSISDEPSVIRGMYNSISLGIYLQVVLLILYAVSSVYRVSYVIAACMVGMAVPQLISTVIYKSTQTKPKSE